VNTISQVHLQSDDCFGREAEKAIIFETLESLEGGNSFCVACEARDFFFHLEKESENFRIFFCLRVFLIYSGEGRYGKDEIEYGSHQDGHLSLGVCSPSPLPSPFLSPYSCRLSNESYSTRIAFTSGDSIARDTPFLAWASVFIQLLNFTSDKKVCHAFIFIFPACFPSLRLHP
jgi:hypothetical protein